MVRGRRSSSLMMMNSLGSGLPGVAPAAEGIVVVVEYAESSGCQRNDALDGRKWEGKERPLAAEIIRIVNVHEVRDFMLHQKTIAVQIIQVDEKDFLEQRGGAFHAVSFNHKKHVVIDGG